MPAVVVDIDDTLINTQKRIQEVWKLVLNRQVPLESVESLSSREVFETFGASNTDAWQNFWSVLLCSDSRGKDLLKLDEPVPFAVETLRKWSKNNRIVYFTGRLETARQLTMKELETFDFPLENAELMMFDSEDWNNYANVHSLIGARSRVFSKVARKYEVVRVIDDTPFFFVVYKKFDVADRVGLVRSKRFIPRDYIEQGATRVVESWKQLINDPPEINKVSPQR